MTTATPSTALVTIEPAFTGAERLALAGYRADFRGGSLRFPLVPPRRPISEVRLAFIS